MPCAGTLRYNLDPFDKHDDETLVRVLERVGLSGALLDVDVGMNTCHALHAMSLFGLHAPYACKHARAAWYHAMPYMYAMYYAGERASSLSSGQKQLVTSCLCTR